MSAWERADAGVREQALDLSVQFRGLRRGRGQRVGLGKVRRCHRDSPASALVSRDSGCLFNLVNGHS